jgi:hypothetical protein
MKTYSYIRSFAFIALLSFASSTYAVIIVQTVTYDASDYSGSVVTNGFSNNAINPLVVTDDFTPFDPALGTLNSVTLGLSLAFQIDWTDPNPSTSPSIGGGVNIVWNRNGPGEANIYGTGGGNGTGPSASGSLAMSMNTVGTTPGNFNFDLSNFSSPYTLSIVGVSMTVGGSNGATVDYQLTSGSLSVTYDYTAAVPEPATYAALAGLSALGLALLRKRARRPSPSLRCSNNGSKR